MAKATKRTKTQSAIDLESMSMEELTQLSADIKKAMATLEKRRRKEARDAMEKVAREFGMSVSEVLGSTSAPKRSAGASAPAKYANPANKAQTWSGRGRQPAWYKDAIAGGAKPESLEV